MCEVCAARISGWQGWIDVPDPAQAGGSGEWSDLAHVITEELSRAPSFPQPRITRLLERPRHTANVTSVDMVVHHGTHVDAPRHLFNDGPSFEEIPLERLYGRGVVWRIHKGPFAPITAEDLERATPRMQPGDIVLIDTDWARRINTDEYEDHAFLTDEAAGWLVRQGAKLLGVDFSSPDLTAHRRPQGFNWPVHNILLSNGVLIAEHVTNYQHLAGAEIEAMFLGIKVTQGDGAPARVIARPLR